MISTAIVWANITDAKLVESADASAKDGGQPSAPQQFSSKRGVSQEKVGGNQVRIYGEDVMSRSGETKRSKKMRRRHVLRFHACNWQ